MANSSRSAITGRYVTPATAARHLRPTVTESGGSNSSDTHHGRSVELHCSQ
jgi:hypothetical protein